MKFTYDTETDSISSPDLDAQQTAAIQAVLARALYRNERVQDVAKALLETANKVENANKQEGESGWAAPLRRPSN